MLGERKLPRIHIILTFLRFTFSHNNKNHNTKEFIYTGNKISIKNNSVLHCSPVVIESIFKLHNKRQK